jgi:hypothetical protein
MSASLRENSGIGRKVELFPFLAVVFRPVLFSKVIEENIEDGNDFKSAYNHIDYKHKF